MPVFKSRDSAARAQVLFHESKKNSTLLFSLGIGALLRSSVVTSVTC